MDWLGSLLDKTIANPQAVQTLIIFVLVGMLARDKLPFFGRKERLVRQAASAIAAVDAVSIAKLEGQFNTHDLRIKNLEETMREALQVIRSHIQESNKVSERM